MKRHVILIAGLFISILLLPNTKANTESKDNEKAEDLKIIVTSLNITDKSLNMTYEIRNNSEEEVWIYTGGYQFTDNKFGMGAGVYVSEDKRSIMIRSLFNDKSNILANEPTFARFVRLGAGKSQTESIFMDVPIHAAPLSEFTREQGQKVDYATHITIELSYFIGAIPERIITTLEEEESDRPIDSHGPVFPHLFSGRNECLVSREDEFLVCEDGYNGLRNESQQILKTIIDDVHIPYKETSNYSVRYERPKLTYCTKIEMKYQPSTLEYFFPFAFQQNLLSSDELEHLQSEKVFVIEDTSQIKFIANDISKASTGITYSYGLIARYRSNVYLNAYYDGKPPISCIIYNDNTYRVKGNVLSCPEGFPSLRSLAPHIHTIDLRMQCAANLKNQWYRFRLYRYNEAVRLKDPSIRNQKVYPKPSQWCDNILQPFIASGALTKMEKIHNCPATSGGKNHYAMNPNCKPNSPGEMVLLFETKAGWNQHGGPELFTFDNHDPKGGCVLLNDGTVKFIRTKEELNALKWK